MKKLTQLKAKLSNNKGKRYLKNGLQIGVLGAVLTAGAFFANHQNQKTPYSVCATTNSQHNQTVGNGQYYFHDYLNQHAINTPAEIDQCLIFGNLYDQDVNNRFMNSLGKRPAAAAYFQVYHQIMQEQMHQDSPSSRFDAILQSKYVATNMVLTDIIKNLPNEDEQYAFCHCYEILGNEAYRHGCGENHVPEKIATRYQNNRFLLDSYVKSGIYDGKELFHQIDLDAEYGANNFRGVTGLLDQLLQTATDRMNQNPALSLQGDLRVADLHHVINQALAYRSLTAVHDLTAPTLDHDHCQINDASLGSYAIWFKTMQQDAAPTREY